MTNHVRGWLAKVLGVALVLPALAGTPLESAAQATGAVTGRVIDGETRLALAGASIQIASLNREVVTNQEGRFALLGLPAGRYRVEVVFLGYGRTSQEVTVQAGGIGSVTFEIVPEAIEVSGLTVTGARRGQAAALNQQLNSNSVTNIVAADQIGRFPDANIGDAMKRIPGVVVIQDQGEARFGLIRGTEPRLNSVMINGERIPSAEAEVREVQLDLIPSDMVSAIEVNKTLTPDMDADAIGGAVNIVTRAAPADRRISATLGSGYNFLADDPMGIASAVVADRFLDDKLGVVLSGSWFNHGLGSDNIEGEWDQFGGGNPYLAEFQIREYQIRRIRRSLSASFDYRLNAGNTITWRSIYNHRDDWENRFRTVFGLEEPVAGQQEVEIERESKGGIGNDRVDFRRLEDQRTQSHSLSGDHLLGRGIRLEWSGQYARASEERLNERYINFVAEGQTATVDISNPGRPRVNVVGGDPSLATFELDELTEENQFTEDEDFNGRLDLTLPFRAGRTEIKIGGRYRDKNKLRDNDFFEYDALGFSTLADVSTADYTNSGFLAGNYPIGTLATQRFLGDLDLTDTNRFDGGLAPAEFQADNFEAGETILGGYLMATQKLGDKATLVGGVRVENTQIDYQGFRFVEDTEEATPVSGDRDYTNIFPSLQLRYAVGPRTVIRAAWTNTLARPNYFDLVPFQVINQEDNEIAIGNPDLDPTTSMNFDLMYEQYFSNVGIFSAGVFYKDISDFIFEYTVQNGVVNGTTYDEVAQSQNGGDAALLGFEVAFQRTLDFLPGPLAGLGIYGNYTFNDSQVDGLPIDGRQNEDLPLPGTSRHTWNGSLSWDYDRFSLRASVNYQDDFLDPGEVGDEAFFDRYYDAQTIVDLNGTVVLTPSARFFFEANNLTNEPLRYYQGVSSRVMQEEFYDIRFQAGLKVDLR